MDLREKHRNLITEDFGRVAANGLKVLEMAFKTIPLVNGINNYTVLLQRYQLQLLLNKFIKRLVHYRPFLFDFYQFNE